MVLGKLLGSCGVIRTLLPVVLGKLIGSCGVIRTATCGVGEAAGLMRSHEDCYQVAHRPAQVVKHLTDRGRCHALLHHTTDSRDKTIRSVHLCCSIKTLILRLHGYAYGVNCVGKTYQNSFNIWFLDSTFWSRLPKSVKENLVFSRTLGLLYKVNSRFQRNLTAYTLYSIHILYTYSIQYCTWAGNQVAEMARGAEQRMIPAQT